MKIETERWRKFWSECFTYEDQADCADRILMEALEEIDSLRDANAELIKERDEARVIAHRLRNCLQLETGGDWVSDFECESELDAMNAWPAPEEP